MAEIQSVPRKYVPLVKKYPNIKQLVKMRQGRVHTLSGGPLDVAWSDGKVRLSYGGHQAEMYRGDLKEILQVAEERYIERGKLSAVVVKTVFTPHISIFEKPRLEKILRLTIDRKEVFLVLDELLWFIRAT